MNWLSRFWNGAKTTTKSVQSAVIVGVRHMLAGALPGGWISDHREEVKHFTGFNYVAIHAIATQVMGAEVSAFSDGSSPKGQSVGRNRRKSLRAKFGTLAKYKSIYGQEEKETTTLDHKHPLVQLLQNPNPWETGAVFNYKRAQQIRLTGTCLVWNVPSVAGPVCQRFVLPTAQVTPVQPTSDMPLGGFRVSTACSRYVNIADQGFVEGGTGWSNILGKVIDARQVQVIRLPHPYYFDDGQSPISAGAAWIDTESGVNDARVGQLRNGADPSLIWTLPPDVSPDQDEMDRATLKVNQKYAGADNQSKILLATAGTVIDKVSSTPKDMCYTEAFADVKSSVLSLHQTPPVAVGLQEPGAYAAYFASMLAWRHSAIQPLCDLLAESDTKHIAPQFGDGLTIEIESPAIDDKDQEEKEFANNVTARICKLNELRAIRGLPPYEGPEGEQLWPPQPVKQAAPGADDSNSPNKPIGKSKSLLAAIEAADEVDFERLVNKIKGRLQQEDIEPEPARFSMDDLLRPRTNGHRNGKAVV